MILIAPQARVPRAALPKRELSRFLVDACERAGVQGEVTVLLTTNKHMHELNRSFRRKNKPTDVLSFPAAPAAFAGEEAAGGDLAISLETARRQADELGHSLLVEVEILMLHGLLHLAGHDHEQDTGQMARKEATLRRHFGLPAGLIQRASQSDAKPETRKIPRKAVAVHTSQKRDMGRPVPATSRNRSVAHPAAPTSRKRDVARPVSLTAAANKLAAKARAR